MAKKKKTTAGKSGKKKSSTGGGKMAGFVNSNKLIGLAAGAFGNNLIKKIPGTVKMNPKLLSALKIVGGEWLPKQQFAKSALQNDAMRQAAGDALIYEGLKELMAGFGIAGMRQRTKPRGNEFLAVSIEGLDKADEVNADVLAEDEFEIGEEINEDVVNGDDLDTVNDDVLGEDDMNEDIGDIDTVNEDILGDDDM